MNKYLVTVLCVCILFFFESFLIHPVEKMSMGSMKYGNGSLMVNITLFVEDMDVVLSQINKTNISFQEYTKEPFPKPLLEMVQNYFRSKFSIKINNQIIPQSFQGISWITQTMNTDNAAIKVHVNYSYNQNQINKIAITNALLINEVYGQKNILNIEVKDKINTLVFDKGTQTIEEIIN